MSSIDYTTLIVALLNALPGLVSAFENWFKDNPRLQGETDEAYAARINAETLRMAKDTTDTNTSVIK